MSSIATSAANQPVATTATPTTTNKAPNIGNNDSSGIWVGGKPTDSTWKSSENQRPRSIYCYRSGKDIKQYQARISGTTTK